MPNKYDLVLFDMDGTIADTDEMIRQTYYQLFDLYNNGVRKSDEEIFTFSGPPLEETLSNQFPNYELDFILKEYRKISESFYRTTVTPIEGAVEVIKILKSKGIKLGVVTNKIRSASLLTLDIIDMANVFDVLVCYDDIEIGKPNPMGINKAISYLNIPKEKVLYVGDNVVDDISAKNAGIDSAIIYFGKRKIPNELKPTYKLYKFIDLIKEVIYE